MLQKTFQIVVITFLVIFTSVGAIVLFSGLIRFLRPAPTETNWIIAIPRGTFQLTLILLLIAGSVYLLSKRNKLR